MNSTPARVIRPPGRLGGRFRFCRPLDRRPQAQAAARSACIHGKSCGCEVLAELIRGLEKCFAGGRALVSARAPFERRPAHPRRRRHRPRCRRCALAPSHFLPRPPTWSKRRPTWLPTRQSILVLADGASSPPRSPRPPARPLRRPQVPASIRDIVASISAEHGPAKHGSGDAVDSTTPNKATETFIGLPPVDALFGAFVSENDRERVNDPLVQTSNRRARDAPLPLARSSAFGSGPVVHGVRVTIR